MSLLKSLGSFLGALLDAVLPTMLREFRKPKEATMAGGGKELRDDVDEFVTDALDKPTWSGRAKCSGCAHKWVAVVMMRDEDEGSSIPLQPLQCPRCHLMTGLADPKEL